MLASIIRTLVPLLVALIVSLLARAHLTLPPDLVDLLSEGLGVLVAALYYAAVRWLEQHRKEFGWLLGVAKAPIYDATAKQDEASPSGESAAPASQFPEGAPVETVPVDGAPDTADAAQLP